MEEKLLKLIYDYSINGKIVDSDYIEQLIDIFITHEHISQYLLDVQFIEKLICEKEESVSVAAYNPITRIIRVYNDSVIKTLNAKNIGYSYLNDVESIFYRNLIITQIILQELERVNQQSMLDNGTDVESTILKYYYKALKNEAEYEKIVKQRRRISHHEIDICERLSQIKSYKTIVETISQFSDVIPNLILLEETGYLSSMINEYNDVKGVITSPTIQYLKDYGCENELLNFTWYDGTYVKSLNKCMLMHSLEDRLLYGLPIEKDEYYNVKNDIQYKLQKLRLNKNT